MLKIDCPQVYLYSYQLSRETKDNSIWTWANNIWQHFNSTSKQTFPKKDLSFPLSSPEKFHYSDRIEGSLRFCSLDDSIGILARIGCPETDKNKNLTAEIFKELNPNNLMIPPSYENWLGQTILITCKLSILPITEQLKEIVDECVKYLLPASHLPSQCRMTKLFNRPIFEYSSIPGQLQVLVYLIDDNSEKSFGRALQPIFELFYHRHKITKAFIDSRKNYDFAHKLYIEIENNIEGLETSLAIKEGQYLQELKTKIKKLLHDSIPYQRTLQTLEDFDNTISIHDYNYQQKLLEISNQTQITLEELTTFSLFIEKTTPYLQRQIKADLGYFKHGTDLVETAIASIRGIVEIEQAEGDRHLQTLVAVVGVGIGVAGVTATAFPYYKKPPDSPKAIQLFRGDFSPHLITQSITISLLIGFLASMGVWGAIYLYRKLKERIKLAEKIKIKP